MTQLEISEVAPGRYRLGGELDMASAETLDGALRPVVDTQGHIVLDLADLTFIDSSGIRALVDLSRQMNGAAPLVLTKVSPSVKRVLDIVGIETLPGIEVEQDA